MFYAGFAGELARSIADDRTGGRRRLSSGDRARVAAREERERSVRAFEQRLSLSAAISLLALALFGLGAAVLLGGAAIAFAIAATRRRPAPPGDAVRRPTDPDVRWGVWRRVEPDAEYLRGRAA
jgi:hypothetical protein